MTVSRARALHTACTSIEHRGGVGAVPQRTYWTRRRLPRQTDSFGLDATQGVTVTGSTPTTIALTLLLAAIGLKITDLVKYAVAAFRADSTERAEGRNGLLTNLLTAVLGFLVVQIGLKPSAWGRQLRVGETLVSDLSFGSTILFGIAFTAVAGTLYDFKKAIDNGDNAKKPKLLSAAETPADQAVD